MLLKEASLQLKYGANKVRFLQEQAVFKYCGNISRDDFHIVTFDVNSVVRIHASKANVWVYG